MAGIIKVNQYQDFNGNTLFTSDGSGNLTTQNISEPCLKVIRASSNQTSVSSATYTKVQFNSEDTDVTTSGTWDSTNYRWTPGLAGKYFCYARLRSTAGSNNTASHFAYIQKNGDSNTRIAGYADFSADKPGNYTQHVGGIQEMNVSTDYIEFYGRVDDSSGSPDFVGNSNQRYTAFGAYRIGS